jgi:Ca2+-transporting ATPase
MIVEQFSDLMVVVLLVAAVLAGVVGEPQDSVAIVAIILLNATLGVVQDYRAERAVASLRALAAPSARVVRDGAPQTIPAAGLVPGDLVLVETGDIVPADLRLIDVHNLRVDESALTGESQAVEKSTTALPAEASALGDRRNMAWKGTVASYGRGAGLVVAIGLGTELGRIATLLGVAEPALTPLQRRLKRFAAQLAVIVLVICAVVFGIGLLRGEPPVLMFLTAVSLAVAAMPEALPAVVTVALALGARRMARQRGLVRRLHAVETLGSVTVICTDKTGTLTANRMTVTQVRRPPTWDVAVLTDAHDPLARALALNTDAVRREDGQVTGEATEAALLHHVTTALPGVLRHAERYPRVDELPFSSERGRMTTRHVHDEEGDFLVMKGSPERVMARCSHAWAPGGPIPLAREAAEDAAARMAREGLRVIAFAHRDDPVGGEVALGEHHEADFVLLGLVGLLDAPRPEAHAAVEECHRAGIRVVMITGDHPGTADAVAGLVGVRTATAPPAVTGADLATWDDDALAERVEHVAVYARVAPEHKLRIVRALQQRGECVAMTGDGVNDAPALRRADIGVAMGKGGTDVARDAADLVLLDDHFATIVSAVREGRRIYDNIRRFVRYVLTGNSAEIWLLFLAPFVGLPLPLLPIHILWVNLVTDGLPGLALAVEPAERTVMERPPRPPHESVFAHGVWQHALWVGLLMSGVTLAVQGWAYHTGHTHWQTMTFTVLALSQLGHVMAVRSERESLLSLGLGSNRPLTLVVLGTVVLQLLTLYVPFLNAIFKTEPLTGPELAIAFGASTIVLLAVEVEKWLVRHGHLVYRGGAIRAPR